MAWAGHPFRLQPCLCDIWHDHVLFDGENVRGLIDYGGVKIDNVAVDLARLLGSMVGDDREARNAGLRAYNLVRAVAAEEWAIVDVLDKTGTIVGLENWLRWLYFAGKPLNDLSAVSRRLRSLVERVEAWEATRVETV
jgi:Ser/Thr protein kinase RdoA (MazF antagonist)